MVAEIIQQQFHKYNEATTYAGHPINPLYGKLYYQLVIRTLAATTETSHHDSEYELV